MNSLTVFDLKSIFIGLALFVSAAWPDMCNPLQLAGRFKESQSPADIPSAESAMGHKMSITKLYIISDYTWHNMTHDLSNLDPWIGTPIKKLISIPMLPKQDMENCTTVNGKMTCENYTLAQFKELISQGSNGDFDPKWKNFAHQMKNRFGNEELYLRLGWEFNLWTDNPYRGLWGWGADSGNASQWKGYWNKIARVLRDSLPQSKIVWCLGLDLNDRNNGSGSDPNHYPDDLLYPGDSTVDIIGIDMFDKDPSVAGTNWYGIWQSDIYDGGSGGRGLKFWSHFARSHGKPLSFPEWGMVSSSENPGSYGNDNPFYILRMYEFITNPENNVLFHVYTPHYHGANTMPEGMKEYNRLFAPYYNHCDATRPTWIGRKTLLLNAWQRAE